MQSLPGHIGKRSYGGYSQHIETQRKSFRAEVGDKNHIGAGSPLAASALARAKFFWGDVGWPFAEPKEWPRYEAILTNGGVAKVRKLRHRAANDAQGWCTVW